MAGTAIPRVIVLGGGLGGTVAAYDLRRKLKGMAEIHVVSDSAMFSFVPSNPWVAVGWRRPEAIQIELAPALARKQIGFTHSAVMRLSPREKRIELADGSSLPYDYLVVATGPDLAFDEIEGFGPQANTVSICRTGHAQDAALANGPRLLLLCHLAVAGELPVGVLVERIGLSQSAVSQHLAKLRQRGLVEYRRDGLMLHYRVADPKVLRVLHLLHELYCPELESRPT